GVLELVGAAGLIVPRTRNLAGVALALLFVALLPTNIHAARAGLNLGGSPVTTLWLRIPEQLLFIAIALTPAWTTRRRAAERPLFSRDCSPTSRLPVCAAGSPPSELPVISCPCGE
ncbi:MAG: hypothetical protein ABJC89_19195, partial [Acidobacteriota bacterium]